ncbi:calcium-activated chloride channel regulator 1-like [Gracilinanus agilis]|uniref:calcium-activated chloride channel regulator 1-like n=1 Tax=Gracilinanus agilis TaxID=191870 RepID=UPI001CFE8C1E|nr:calcium-activated chloride channel regulator 1-like [Gracilinanus agilis]
MRKKNPLGKRVTVPFKMLIFILTLYLLQGADTSLVKLNGNGYEDVVIAIDPDVPEDEKLIQQITDVISEASTYLYGATEKRFYFKAISILIPKTWKPKSDYERPKLETYKNADIIIEVPNPPGNDIPRTDQFGQCGERGKRIHLTPGIILGEMLNAFGPQGKVLVHEWAHFRWGVFEEYNEDEPFYLSNGKNLPVRCSDAITGTNKVYTCSGGSCPIRNCETDPETGKLDKNCMFIPDKIQTEKASIMFLQGIDSVVEFCTEKNHNRIAPNAQNKMCNQKSTWEVIQDSEDYKNSTPMMAAKPPKPSFSLKQIGERILVLVLDKSRSMAGGNRLNRLNQASQLFLLQIIEKGSWTGMVTFDSSATIQSDLIQIETDAQRNVLISRLPTFASGGTYICSGLRTAFMVIKKKFLTDGSEIILLTDGEDNTINTCFEEVEQSGAIIHTIALGPSAEKSLEKLSEMTGGMKTTATDNIQNNGLIDAFSALSSGNGAITQKSIQLESKGVSLTKEDWMNGTVIFDSTVGNDTLFLVTWTAQQPEMFVRDPSGNIYINFSVEASSKMAYLRIPNTAEVGIWTYSLKSSAQTLTLTVTSRAANPIVPPITVDSKMNKDNSSFPSPMIVYAEVRQGSLPIIGANVIALIESADGTTETLELLDNGAGADSFKNDGVYSRYFTAYKTDGRYSLKVRALGGTNTQRPRSQVNGALYIPGWVENGEIKMNPPKPEISEDKNQEDMQSFSRTASGGSFIVSNIPNPMPDVFPPNQIIDLEAYVEEDRINLTWTAPGDDYDTGRAKEYIIKMSKNILTLRENFDAALQVNTTDLIPNDANSKEVFMFKPKGFIIENGTTIFLAIKAVDKANLTSPISNIAQASLFIPSPEDSFRPAVIVVLSVVGTLAAVVIISSVIVYFLNKKKCHKTKDGIIISVQNKRRL